MAQSFDNNFDSGSVEEEIGKTLELLEEGELKIDLQDQYRDVVLVLGITGAGKSTFVQWLAGDDSKLISKLVDIDYIIEDENRIGNETTKSMTIFPELVVDAKTNTAYYDCPGFDDTRSASNDIAGTYFIKKVAKHAKSVKLVLVVNFNSVKIAGSRHEFPQLLKHSTDLIKDVDKFGGSVALVVTKVDRIDVPDQNLIKSISNFMIKIKEELQNDPNKNNTSAIKLIDVLLQVDGQNSSSRIGLFRRPDRKGPVSEIPLLQKGKKVIAKIVEELKFTPIDVNDFGYTISAASKNAISGLVSLINDKVWKDLERIVQGVSAHHESFIGELRVKIDSFGIATENVQANEAEAKVLSARLNTGNRTVSDLAREVNSKTTINVLAKLLNSTLTSMEIDTYRDTMANITRQAEHFEFLQMVSDSILETRPWESLFTNLAQLFSTSKQSIHNAVNQVAGMMANTINSTVTDIADEFWKSRFNQMQSWDIQKLPAQLELDSSNMQKMQIELNKANRAEQLATIINGYLGLDNGLINSKSSTIFTRGKYLNYLQALSDRPLNIWSSDWIAPLHQAAKSIHDASNWYPFLNSLYSKLGEYEFQRDTSRFNVANLEDWGNDKATQKDIHIDDKNLSQFLDILKQYNISGSDAIKDIQVALWQLNELNDVLRLTLKQGKSMPDCSEKGKLVVRGDYVKLSDLKAKLVDNCPGSVSAVNIFASNTLFIDSDVDGVGNKLKFTLMAPKWEVVGGKRRINIDGCSGKAHDPSKATNVNSPGMKPHMGKPGLPGGSAGNFIGIGQQFVNQDSLSISANGGVGGSGQEGGNGPPGRAGKDAQPPNSNCNVGPVLETGFLLTYLISGEAGTSGEQGADGGAGGIGGKEGSILMCNLNDAHKLVMMTNDGASGIGGSGGLGGYQGLQGNDIYATCERYYNSGGGFNKKLLSAEVRTHKYKESTRTKSGSYGANRENISDPEPASKFERPADAINDYKKYLRSNLNGVQDRYKRNTIITLIGQIDKQTSHMYDSLALAGELESLEEQSRSLRNKNDLIHFYESLSSRITDYAKSPKPKEQSLQYKKALNYVYAAALGKLYNLRAGEKTNLIIDVEGYLSYVQENMNTLNDLRRKHNEHEIVQEQKKKYRENIEQQIAEAKHFIDTLIKPEFDNIGNEIDAKIDQLIKDTEELERDAQNKKEELVRKREELQKQMVLRGIFSALKVVGQVASFVGPHGAAIGTVIGGVGSLAEGFVLDDQTGAGKEFKMPPGIKDNIKFAENDYKAFFAEAAKDLKTKLDEIKKQIQPVPELNDLAQQLDSISKRLPSNSREPNFLVELKELDEETKTLLKAKEKEIKKNKENGEKWSERSVKAVNYANKVSQMGTVALDVYSKLKGDQAKIDATDNALRDIEQKLQQIDQYKKDITRKMAPEMHNLMSDFDKINLNLDKKSLVALDVQKWQAQSMLRNLKVDIQKFVSGQQVEADLMRCFEKLDETMSIIIKIYDRIQNFQQQQQLTDFIANVNSPTASSIKIDDPELARAVNKLDIVIRSNVVLQQFDSTVAALKQMVFPYARHYLEKLSLSTNSKLNLNDAYIDELVSDANAELAKIKSKVTENKTTISKVDTNTQSLEFDSTNPCIQAPFYVWSNAEHAKTLAKLLSGESVSLKADIRHSDHPDKDAIKFLNVKFNFKVKSDVLQSEIESKLDKFKISANHTGNSYYRYGDKYYVINHNALNIEYSFKKRENGDPIESSGAYDKIQKGTLTLSPYAMWQVTLLKMDQTISFDQMTKYKNELYLELVGPGKYIKSQVALNDDLQLEKYYNEHVYNDTGSDQTDLAEQLYESEKMYKSMALKRVQCREYLAQRKVSNLIHKSEDGGLNQANTTDTLSYNSQLNQTVSNYFGGNNNNSSSSAETFPPIGDAKFEYINQPNSTKANLTQSLNSVDVQGNLLMGQLLVGLIGGKNKTLINGTCISPKQTHEMQVETLAQRVLPTLEQTSVTRLNQIHNSNNQWHRDLFPVNDTSTSSGDPN